MPHPVSEKNIESSITKRYARTEWPRLLVFHEKHGEQYFYVDSVESLARTALHVLKQRHKEKWYCSPGANPYGLKEEITKEAAEALPEPYRKMALETRARNAHAWKQHKSELDDWNDIKTAIDTSDPWLAFVVLDNRIDYEHERFSLEKIVTV